jgi:SAM-dependent methyltransferase
MNQHTIAAKAWLDRRYSRKAGGDYLAHQPIYGISTGNAEPNAVLRFARTYHLLERLHALDFDSVLDVGGGEGYLAALIRDLFGTKVAHCSDLSAEACRRAGEIFDVQGAGADATKLPFADQSYDLVVCSEVIEHLSRPAAAIAELARIARKYVVITTSEFCPTGDLERRLRIWQLDGSYEHSEMNWFTADDFRGLLGRDVSIGAQYRNLEHLIPSVEWNRPRVERALELLTASDDVDVDHAGVIVVSPRNNAPMAQERARLSTQRRREILDRLLEPVIAQRDGADIKAAELGDEIVHRMHCMRCRGALKHAADGNTVICLGCSQTYEVKGGVPSMFLDGADDDHVGTLDAECAKRLAGGDAAREREVRAVFERLHDHSAKKNPEWKQKAGTQLLRVLWLYSRDEPLAGKAKRLIGQLTGKPPVGAAEVRAALLSEESQASFGERMPRREGVSGI